MPAPGAQRPQPRDFLEGEDDRQAIRFFRHRQIHLHVKVRTLQVREQLEKNATPVTIAEVGAAPSTGVPILSNLTSVW